MSAETWAQLIVKYCISDPELFFNGSDLNKALNDRSNTLLREEMDLKTNVPAMHISIFRNYLRLHKEKKQTYYYYATKQGRTPVNLGNWRDNICKAKDLLNKVFTRATSTNKTISLIDGITESRKKRKIDFGLKTSEALVLELNTPISIISEVHSSSSVHHHPSINLTFPISYWDSPEARILFSAKHGESTQQSIEKQIEILQNANRTEESYLEVVEGGEEMDQSTLTNHMKHQIRIKSQLLCMSLHLALEKMNGWTWNKCCTEAITISKKMGISTVNNAKTVERWYRSFRNKVFSSFQQKQKTTYLHFWI